MTKPTLVGGWVCLSSLKRWSTSRTSNMNAEVSVRTGSTGAVCVTGNGEGMHILLFILQKLHIREINWWPAQQMFGLVSLNGLGQSVCFEFHVNVFSRTNTCVIHRLYLPTVLYPVASCMVYIFWAPLAL